MKYKINKEDIIKRIYFILNLVQSQNGSTMQGSLTSKSDAIGGIFDRFINSLSEDIIFEKEIISRIVTNKKVSVIKDYYLYKAGKMNAGLAPDIFGLQINDKKIPFVEFDEKWKPIEGMPQVEVKTFKAKDQMISLRNQDYDNQYLVLVDLDLRIDYLVPFFDKSILKDDISKDMQMDDSIFIKNDSKNKLKKIKPINFENENIGEIELISITKGDDYMKQATFCSSNVSPIRVKEINERSVKCKEDSGFVINDFANISTRVPSLFEFNSKWYSKWNVDITKDVYLDFSGSKLDKIKINRFNNSGIVITAIENGCTFNNLELKKDIQYVILFEKLDRKGNNGVEYFMQKECAHFLKNKIDELKQEFETIINSI